MSKKVKATIIDNEIVSSGGANGPNLSQHSGTNPNDNISGCALSDIRSIESKKGCGLVAVAASMLFFCVIVPMCGDSEKDRPSNTELGKKRTAERILKELLNYPDSYSLQGWKVEGNKVTLEYKAKNAFGMEKTERTVITVE